MQFLQKSIVQKLLLALAILFVLDIGYRVFLEKPYYLQSAGGGIAYRINKKTGEVYYIRGNVMERVEEYPYRDYYAEEIEGKKGFLSKLGAFIARDLGLYYIVPRYELQINYKVMGTLVLSSYLISLFLCPFLAVRKGRNWLRWLVLTLFFSWISIGALLILRPKFLHNTNPSLRY